MPRVTEFIRLSPVLRFRTPEPAFLLQLAITVPVPQTGYYSCKGDDIGHPPMFSLRYLAKRSHRSLVKAIEHPAAFKNKRRNLGVSHLGKGFHDTVSASDFQRV